MAVKLAAEVPTALRTTGPSLPDSLSTVTMPAVSPAGTCLVPLCRSRGGPLLRFQAMPENCSDSEPPLTFNHNDHVSTPPSLGPERRSCVYAMRQIRRMEGVKGNGEGRTVAEKLVGRRISWFPLCA